MKPSVWKGDEREEREINKKNDHGKEWGEQRGWWGEGTSCLSLITRLSCLCCALIMGEQRHPLARDSVQRAGFQVCCSAASCTAHGDRPQPHHESRGRRRGEKEEETHPWHLLPSLMETCPPAVYVAVRFPGQELLPRPRAALTDGSV